MEEKKDYPTKVKEVWTNFFYMPFIIVSGFFDLSLSWGFTLIGKEELQKEMLKAGYFLFFIERYAIFFLFGLILSLGITFISVFIVYFSTKDKREPIAVFKTSLIFHSICVLLGCYLFVKPVCE